MPRRPLTQAELAKLPPETLKKTLQKRAERDRKKAAADAAKRAKRVPLSVVSFTEAASKQAAKKSKPQPQQHAPAPAATGSTPGIPDGNQRAREMYEALKAKFQEVGRWNDEGMHGMLVAYCQCVIQIEEAGASDVPPSVLSTIPRVWKDLRMEELPAARVQKESKFGSW